MAIDFGKIWITLLFIPLAGFVIWTFLRAHPLRSRKGILTTFIRCIIILLLVLSLAGISLKKYTHMTTVIFAVDLSGSTQDVREEMNEFIRSAMKKKPRDFQTGIVAFGRDSLVEQPVNENPLFDSMETMPDPHFTDIDAGLQMAGALIPGDTKKRIVLMSDGNQNMGDAIERARSLAQQGIRIDGVFFSSIPSQEVQISSLEVPTQLYTGESYDIYITIDSTVNTSGTLSLYADRKLISRQGVELQKGENRFVFKDTAHEGGIKSYEAHLQTDVDGIIQNNKMASHVNIKGPPVLAVVEGQEDEGREIIKILQAAGMEVKSFTAQTLPDQLDELRKYHGLVLANVSADDLGENKIRMLDTYVKSLGRGLLVTGGDNSYSLGGYMGTALEEMLPIELDISQKADFPSLGLVLVIDRSGSMAEGQYGVSKMDMAKEAAIRSTQALRTDDLIGVVTFDSAANWVVETQRYEKQDEVIDAIASIPVGGGTNIFPGLEMAYSSLKDAHVGLKHVILLTDGQSHRGDYETIVKEMTQAGITLSTVAVGSDADTGLLENLAGWGNGRYYFTDQFSDIPKIFTKETYLATQSYIQNRSFYPAVTRHSPIITGFDQGFPPLHGYIAATAKSSANMVLSSDRSHPILAEWQYGLGRVVAWTSDLRGIWTEDWILWPEGQDFWLNVVSHILPEDDLSQGFIETENLGDRGKVTLMLGDGNLDRTLDSCGIVVDPEGVQHEFALNLVGPGKYSGSFDTRMPGVYLVKVEQRHDGRVVNTMETGLTVSYSPEYDIRKTNSKDYFERIISQTGGRILDDPGELFRDDSEPVWAQTEMWPHLLPLALILFVLDIALRRLKVEAFFSSLSRRYQARRIGKKPGMDADRAVPVEEDGQGKAASGKGRGQKAVHGELPQDDEPRLSSRLLDARKGSGRRKL